MRRLDVFRTCYVGSLKGGALGSKFEFLNHFFGFSFYFSALFLIMLLQGNLHMSVLASLASAVVWMGELPVKLNPVIQPLMAAIKREQVLEEVSVSCSRTFPKQNCVCNF